MWWVGDNVVVEMSMGRWEWWFACRWLMGLLLDTLFLLVTGVFGSWMVFKSGCVGDVGKLYYTDSDYVLGFAEVM